MKSPYYSSSPDYFFIAIVVSLTIFGLVMLMSASSDLGKQVHDDGFYFVRGQIIKGLLVGAAGFLFALFFPYRKYEKIAIPFLAISIILLALVFSPLGEKKMGAERWINLIFFSFQPGEIVKLSFLIFLAAWVSKDSKRKKDFSKGFLPFIILLSVIGLLLIFQPSTTTAAIIVFSSLVIYLVAGGRWLYILSVTLLGIILFTALVLLTPYRFERMKSFISPETANPLEERYHIDKALIAIGSGGITGVGFGESTTKLQYLPEPIGDSIFAVIAEELGFIGSVSVIVFFFLFTWRGIIIGRSVKDEFGRLLAVGFSSLIGFQAFINIGAISGLIPLTGVPLPFISYGGTALAVFLTMSGIIANISRRKQYG